MTPENEVNFPMTGEESHAFMCVRLYSEAGATKAEPSLRGPMKESADYEFPPDAGDPHEVLRNAREFAGLRGLDMRIQLDGVEWNPELGQLV